MSSFVAAFSSRDGRVAPQSTSSSGRLPRSYLPPGDARAERERKGGFRGGAWRARMQVRCRRAPKSGIPSRVNEAPMSRPRAHAHLLHFTRVLLWGRRRSSARASASRRSRSCSIGSSSSPRSWPASRRAGGALPVPRQLAGLRGGGVLVALHWIIFYGTIRSAQTSPSRALPRRSFFTALEPLVFRRRVRRRLALRSTRGRRCGAAPFASGPPDYAMEWSQPVLRRVPGPGTASSPPSRPSA